MKTLSINNAKSFNLYITTYKRLNEYGGASGDWFDLYEYTSAEEFYNELKGYFNDETDPEWYVADYDCPFDLSEIEIDDDLFHFAEYYLESDNQYIIEAYYKLRGGDLTIDLIEEAETRYLGEFDNYEDLGRYFVQELGMLEIPSNIEYYFDYEKYGRDLSYELESYDNHYFYSH